MKDWDSLNTQLENYLPSISRKAKISKWDKVNESVWELLNRMERVTERLRD